MSIYCKPATYLTRRGTRSPPPERRALSTFRGGIGTSTSTQLGFYRQQRVFILWFKSRNNQPISCSRSPRFSHCNRSHTALAIATSCNATPLLSNTVRSPGFLEGLTRRHLRRHHEAHVRCGASCVRGVGRHPAHAPRAGHLSLPWAAFNRVPNSTAAASRSAVKYCPSPRSTVCARLRWHRIALGAAVGRAVANGMRWRAGRQTRCVGIHIGRPARDDRHRIADKTEVLAPDCE